MIREMTREKTRRARTARRRGGALLAALALLIVGPASLLLTTRAWAQNDTPPKQTADQLDKIVAPIALYPDPLLAQVMAASTFPDQIPGAYQWSSDHANLKGDALTNAMQNGQLPYDPSVQALLPFPSVLKMMNSDIDWTARLGNAVLSQRGDVMDAVQRMRKEAYDEGNLKTTQQQKVDVQGSGSSQVIVVQPANPQVVYVPTYSPQVVYTQPAPANNSAAVAAGFLGFVTGVALTAAFCDSCWGWHGGCNWYSHTVIINNGAWGRTWVNRSTYVHTWGGYNANFYSRPYSYVNRPLNVNINNVNVNRNVNVNNRNVYNRNTNYNTNVNRNVNNNVNRNYNTNVNRNTNVNNNVNRNANVNRNVNNNQNYTRNANLNQNVNRNNNVNANRSQNVNRSGNVGTAQNRPANTSQNYNRGGSFGANQNQHASRGYSGSTPGGSAFSGVSNGRSEAAAGARGRASYGGRMR
jgi:hypothetical protein